MIDLLTMPNIRHNLPIEAYGFFNDNDNEFMISDPDGHLVDFSSSEIIDAMLLHVQGMSGCCFSQEAGGAVLTLHGKERTLEINRMSDNNIEVTIFSA